MWDILYTIFIFPVEMIMELAYVFILRVTRNPALSVLGVSLALNVLILPLYFMAERLQNEEREFQKRMKAGVDNIKSVFSGDERFMLLSTFYRQNNYHPVYALRSSISLLIQIPFFIGAYHFLSHLEIIKGISFGPINDLAKPDSLFAIGGITINILPVLMTFINCIAVIIYTKDAPFKEKIQLYGMAAVFLVLLYNSPSALVIYWTGNNLFSLFKNIIQKTKNPKKLTFILFASFCLFLVVYILFFHDGWIIKRIIITAVITIIVILPLIFKLFMRIISKIPLKKPPKSTLTDKESKSIFIFSAIAIFMLSGFVIPSNLIASSVQEFSFIENYKSPFPFLLNISLQSLGLFVLWPLCIYFMFSQKVKNVMAVLAAVFFSIALINVFIFTGNYGHLTLMFNFSEAVSSSRIMYIINIAAILITAAVITIIVFYFSKILKTVIIISISAFLILITINNVNIFKNYNALKIQIEKNENQPDEKIYHFSSEGKNVLVIMLDMAVSGFVPYIFEEKPELLNSFDGFKWYKNAVSFGRYTVFGSPGLFGGYEYTPLEMNKRKDIPLVEKHNEALLLLPRLFTENGFKATVTNPTYANHNWTPDLSIFNNYPKINANNIIGKHNASWIQNNQSDIEMDLTGIIKTYMIRLTFLKFVPMITRNFIYDNGRWVSTRMDKYSRLMINNYISLDVLPEISEITDKNENNYIVLTNDLTHEPDHFLQAPDYIPKDKVTDYGDGPFARVRRYHVNISAFIMLGKWFDYLKDNNAYDNTRIIIVSDHGNNQRPVLPDNIILHDNISLESLAALLMVKDFNSSGFEINTEKFMTNADVPVLALENIISDPVNPWTKNPVKSDKSEGVTVTTSSSSQILKQSKYTFNIKSNEWLHVSENIYDLDNWSKVNR